MVRHIEKIMGEYVGIAIDLGPDYTRRFAESLPKDSRGVFLESLKRTNRTFYNESFPEQANSRLEESLS